jgi:hypothetical protein
VPDTVRVARQFLEQLYRGDVVEATRAFGPELRAAVSDTGLATLIERMIQQVGKPLRHAGTRTSKSMTGEADIVYLLWDFERSRVDARMIVTPHNLIVSLSFETPVIR